MGEYELLVAEARSRIAEGIAGSAQECVDQLVEEGLCIAGYEDEALLRQLRADWEVTSRLSANAGGNHP